MVRGLSEYLLSKLRRVTSGESYLPEVDGVRFVAISLVLLAHTHERVLRRVQEFYPNVTEEMLEIAGPGVSIFFALSGFILYRGLKNSLARGTGLRLKSYFLRRITRLEPPYIVVMTGLFLYMILIGYDSPHIRRLHQAPDSLLASWLASMAYCHRLLFGTNPRINGVAWSLELEVQFYLIAPLLTLAIYKLSRNWRPAAAAVVALAWAAIISGWADGTAANNPDNPAAAPSHLAGSVESGSSRSAEPQNLGSASAEVDRDRRTDTIPAHKPRYLSGLGLYVPGLAVYLPMFLLGIAVEELSSTASGRVRFARTGLLADLVGVVSLAALFALFGLWIPSRVWTPWVAVGKTVFVGGALWGMLQGLVFRKFLSLGWVSVIGGMCYSIYLIHMPILEVAANVTARRVGVGLPYPVYFAVQCGVLMSVVLAASIVFYSLVERPCMNKHWPRDLANFVRRRLGLTNPEPTDPVHPAAADITPAARGGRD